MTKTEQFIRYYLELLHIRYFDIKTSMDEDQFVISVKISRNNKGRGIGFLFGKKSIVNSEGTLEKLNATALKIFVNNIYAMESNRKTPRIVDGEVPLPPVAMIIKLVD